MENTHRVYRISAQGTRKMIACGGIQFCEERAIAGRSAYPEHEIVIEAHDGKDPK